MNKKIFGLALVLSLFSLLGACDQTGGGDGTTPDASPSPAETSPSP